MAKPRAPKPDDTPKTLFSIKGAPSWFEWLKSYAEHRGLPVTSLLDFALYEQAKRDGFALPPRRIP